jgi:hypothetical protein
MRNCPVTLTIFALWMAQALVGAPQKVESISYQEAQPLLRALEEGLPDELRLKSPGGQAEIWVQWLSNYGARTRARLVRGMKTAS